MAFASFSASHFGLGLDFMQKRTSMCIYETDLADHVRKWLWN